MSDGSTLARQVPLDQAWSPSDHSEICCLVYATQNGWKLPILFEEMGVPYDWALVDFDKGEQTSERFLAINPNGRIPALIDRARGVTVAESGAILEYAASRFSSALLPTPEEDLQLHLQVKQWLYWQVSGLGPSMGQAMYFQRIAYRRPRFPQADAVVRSRHERGAMKSMDRATQSACLTPGGKIWRSLGRLMSDNIEVC